MQFEKPKTYSSKHPFTTGWMVRGTMAVALMTTFLAGCETPEPRAAIPESNATTEDVAENTNRYLGEIVTVRSEPIEKISPGTFTIEDDQFFGSQPILVINASGQPFVFPEGGTDIQVTGEVRNFVTAEIEREYNLGLEASAYTQYENQPALIAQSIAIAPEPGELTSNPEQYYGKPLAVTGEVDEVQGVNAFTLDEDQLIGGQELLVIQGTPATAPQRPIEDGEKVAVTGVLRPFVVADLEREYEFNWDTGVQQQLEAEYRDKPVLIAENIYPSAIPDSIQ